MLDDFVEVVAGRHVNSDEFGVAGAMGIKVFDEFFEVVAFIFRNIHALAVLGALYKACAGCATTQKPLKRACCSACFMAGKKGLGPVKRFGARYGRTVKHKLAKIEIEQKKDHTCPYCSKDKVHKISYGIWECRKCGSTFTARAYTVGKRATLVEEAQRLVAEFPELRESKSEVIEEEEA